VPNENRPPFPGDRLYAREYGVCVEEALARLDLQDDVARLRAKLRANEQETFGDLEIEHEPDFHFGAGKQEDLYLRDEERQQEACRSGEGDRRAALTVGIGHQCVGQRGQHRAPGEGEQHGQRPFPRACQCGVA
jgi:hypothetical protein